MAIKKSSKSKVKGKVKGKVKSPKEIYVLDYRGLTYNGSTVIKNPALLKSTLKKNKLDREAFLLERKAALEKELKRYPVLKASPKVKDKTTTMVVDSKSILRKTNGRYVMDAFDLNNLMGTLVQMASNHQTGHNLFGRSGLITNIKDFSIKITYRNHGVNMRPMVDGSQRDTWRRKGEKG